MAEFAKDDFSAVRSWKAPAAMYLVISVFPISITSGALPPASVASNFCRWVGQLWYCTLTLTPGCALWNCEVADATTSGHPDCASTCSQTVMLLALVAPETPPAAIANTSAARATKPTAMNFRLFIDEPSIALAGLELFALQGRRLGAADWLVPFAIQSGRLAHLSVYVKTTFSRCVHELPSLGMNRPPGWY